MEGEAGRFCKWLRRLAQGLKAWRGLSIFEDPRSEPGSDDLGATRINLTFGRRSWRPDTMIPHAAGGLERARPIWNSGILSHAVARFAHPDRPGLIRPRRLRLILSLLRELLSHASQATGFMMAPSMSSPAVTYFHKATSSLRASAVIATFLRALVAPTPTRAKYQRAKADCG
jgi:hypothetical protein